MHTISSVFLNSCSKCTFNFKSYSDYTVTHSTACCHMASLLQISHHNYCFVLKKNFFFNCFTANVNYLFIIKLHVCMASYFVMYVAPTSELTGISHKYHVFYLE